MEHRVFRHILVQFSFFLIYISHKVILLSDTSIQNSSLDTTSAGLCPNLPILISVNLAVSVSVLN